MQHVMCVQLDEFSGSKALALSSQTEASEFLNFGIHQMLGVRSRHPGHRSLGTDFYLLMILLISRTKHLRQRSRHTFVLPEKTETLQLHNLIPGAGSVPRSNSKQSCQDGLAGEPTCSRA